MIAALDPAVGLALRGGLALLFLSAAAHKLRDMSAFRSAVVGYELLPGGWVAPMALLVAGIELVVAACLPFSRLAALAASAPLVCYTGAIAINLVRGREIDCGCAGPVARLPVGRGLVVRNLLLIGIASMAALPPAPRALVWLDALTVAASVLFLALLYAATETALANSRAPLLQDRRWSTR